MKTDFFLQCCAQGPELDRDNEKSANVSKRKKNKTKNAKFLHKLAYLMNN